MFFKHRNPHAVEELGNQKLLELIYNVKDSWDHAKETEHAVYEGQVDNELYSRTCRSKNICTFILKRVAIICMAI